MDVGKDRRAPGGFPRGLAVLALGAVIALAAECAWGGLNNGRSPAKAEKGAAEGVRPVSLGIGCDGMLAMIFDEDESVAESEVSPVVFSDECFDPSDIGEVSVSDDGGVIGIVSAEAADDLFRICADRLDANGWIQVQSGQPLRCTFLKETGEVRWLFLDVTQVADSGVAVIVMQGGA